MISFGLWVFPNLVTGVLMRKRNEGLDTHMERKSSTVEVDGTRLPYAEGYQKGKSGTLSVQKRHRHSLTVNFRSDLQHCKRTTICYKGLEG